MTLNELTIDSDNGQIYLIDQIVPLTDFLPPHVISSIDKFRDGKISNLVLHGLPVPDHLPDTPSEIKSSYQSGFPCFILKSIASFLGEQMPKEIENVVRRRTAGVVQEEPWHAHHAVKYSLFYCLRGDNLAQTHIKEDEGVSPSIITYQPGDLAMYNESLTERFSPAYSPSVPQEQDRWLLALAVTK